MLKFKDITITIKMNMIFKSESNRDLKRKYNLLIKNKPPNLFYIDKDIF